MPFRILNKHILAPDVKRLDILAPAIAAKVRPGQFVAVCPEEGDARVPLMVVESDSSKQSISLIFQDDRDTLKRLGAMAIQDEVFAVMGPLGQPMALKSYGVVACVATGFGAARIFPVMRGLRDAGNKVLGVIGAATKRQILLEAPMRLACHELFIATQDGSYGHRGNALDVLNRLLAKYKVQGAFAACDVDVMKTICDATRERKIPTQVQVFPPMVDCMGMCGACRLRVNQDMVLACVDGPHFDGHAIDFDYCRIRFQAQEGSSSCPNHEWPVSRPESASRPFRKWLAGILNE